MQDRFASTVVIAAAIIAAVRLARDNNRQAVASVVRRGERQWH